MLSGQFSWTGDNVVAILVATGLYEPSVNHATLLDVPASARVATSEILTGRTVNVNVVDADDYLYTDGVRPSCQRRSACQLRNQ